MLVSTGPAAYLGSRSLSTIGIRSRVCHAPNRPSDTVGARRGLLSALIRHISSHDKMSRIVILFFFRAKAKKKHVVIRDLFVVNRDKKKITNRDFFLLYEWPTSN